MIINNLSIETSIKMQIMFRNFACWSRHIGNQILLHFLVRPVWPLIQFFGLIHRRMEYHE